MFKKLFISSLIGVFTTLFTVTSFSDEEVQTSPAEVVNQVPESEIYTVTAGSSSSNTVLGGTVMPRKMVNLIAQMPGEVRYIAGEEGDKFNAGAILVGLDTSALMEKRRAAVAGLLSAQAGLANAQVQLRKEIESPNAMSNSMLGGAPSLFSMFSDPIREFSGRGDPDFEEYSNRFGQSIQVQTARNQIETARAGIAELDANIENSKSIAPFDGVIVKKMVEVGDIVQPGMPLVVFADTSVMQIQVEVPARLVAALHENSIVSARLDNSGSLIPARVARIFPMANQGGHTTTVKFELPPGTGARAGMYAEIMIPSAQANKPSQAVIPQSAITWRGSLPAVFQVSDDNRFIKMRTLRLGARMGDKVAVISGIRIGDRILKQPLGSTRSGPYQPPAE